MRLCEPVLAVTPAMIAEGSVLVAERNGALLGLIRAEPDQARGPDDWDLALCFVEPTAMGQGTGRALLEAQRAWLEARDARRLPSCPIRALNPSTVTWAPCAWARRRRTRFPVASCRCW